MGFDLLAIGCLVLLILLLFDVGVSCLGKLGAGVVFYLLIGLDVLIWGLTLL